MIKKKRKQASAIGLKGTLFIIGKSKFLVLTSAANSFPLYKMQRGHWQFYSTHSKYLSAVAQIADAAANTVMHDFTTDNDKAGNL